VKPSRLAVDTNVLLDLADEVDDVLDAASVIDDRLQDADTRPWPTCQSCAPRRHSVMIFPTSELKVTSIAFSYRENIQAMFTFKDALVPRFLANMERWLL